MTQIVTTDIGGTHARFAIATLERGEVELGEPVTLMTGDYVTFEGAWQEFGERSSIDLPRNLAIAVAGPVTGDELSLTNSRWRFNRSEILRQLGLSSIVLVNDFGAVAHSLSAIDDASLLHITGPDEPLPTKGIVTVIGPGTGLGAALLVRRGKQDYEVIETEAGHVDFAPLDAVEDRIVVELRKTFRRVSVERLVSGPGLRNIYDVLSTFEGKRETIRDEADLWSAALNGTDELATVALDRFCMCLGAVAGDLALAHGASAVVIAGGIGKRLQDRLAKSGFANRFIAKGRFERRLAAMPVKLIIYPEPGLLGAAVAFAREHS